MKFSVKLLTTLVHLNTNCYYISMEETHINLFQNSLNPLLNLFASFNFQIDFMSALR